MADKVKLINKLRYYRDRAIFAWLVYIISRQTNASKGRLAMIATWAIIMVLVSVFNHLVTRYP